MHKQVLTIGVKGGFREVDVRHECAAGKTGSRYNGESSPICSVMLSIRIGIRIWLSIVTFRCGQFVRIRSYCTA